MANTFQLYNKKQSLKQIRVILEKEWRLYMG